jgi:hypothetical protein
VSIKKLSKEDLEYGYKYDFSTEDVPPEEVFLKQGRVERAFDLALNTKQ